MKQSTHLKGRLLLIIFGLAGILFLQSSVMDFLRLSKLSGEATLESYAKKVIASCASARFAPSCYDEEIPKLLDYISMEDAFNVTRLIQQKEPSYVYCHVLAHKISFRETARHPDQWKDIITRCPTTMCNNGCPHGVLMEKFNTESLNDEQIEKLKPDIADICEPRGNWHPVPIEISMCHHAIGHLNMYITKANITKSIELCKLAGKKKDGRDYTYPCTQGVFMQIFQPLEPEDYALIGGLTPTKDRVEEFCKPYTGENFNACWTESWPLWRQELYNPAGSINFCSRLKGEEALRTCHAGLLSFITVDFIMTSNDYKGLKRYCVEMPIVSDCFDHAARRLMQIDPLLVDRAFRVCEEAQSVGVGWECYRALANYSRMSFRPATEQFNNYCNRFSDGWRQVCLVGEDNAKLPAKGD